MTRPLWLAVFVLAAGALILPPVAGVISDDWSVLTLVAVNVVIVVALLVTLGMLRSRHGAAEERVASVVRANDAVRHGLSVAEQRVAEAERGADAARAQIAERDTAIAAGMESEESLRLLVVELARRVQVSAHRIQETATVLGERYPAEAELVESTFRVDHAAAQQARHAQSVAVLCGEWPGQQWQEPLALVDVVRAAQGRIAAYQRVQVSGNQDLAVTSEAVEPLVHLVAELLANATQSSPPTTTVPVSVRLVQRGAVVEIDDGGVGMDEHQLELAREIASGRRVVRLDEIGEIPQTGLPVVGAYARRHGFRADVSESPYGGIRAVILVPLNLVTTLDPAESGPVAPPASAPGPTAPPAAVPPEPGAGRTGLPRRVSRRGAGDPPAAPAEGRGTPRAESPQDAGAWMGAFLSDRPDAAGDSGHDER